MTSFASHSPAESPLDLVIFGGAGDLSARKLLPALYMAHLHGSLPADTRIIGVGRGDWSRERYLQFVEKDSRPFIDQHALTPEAWDSFLSCFEYACVDIGVPAS